MTALTDIRNELFARNLALGMKPIDAVAAAGYKRSSTTASTLARKPHIILRVQELIDERQLTLEEKRSQIDAMTQAKDAGLTNEWVLEHLKLNVELAQDAGQFGPALNTLKTIGAFIQMMDGEGKPVPNKDKHDDNTALPSSMNLDYLADALNSAKEDSGATEEEDEDGEFQLAPDDLQEEIDLADIQSALAEEDPDLVEPDPTSPDRGESAKVISPNA